MSSLDDWRGASEPGSQQGHPGGGDLSGDPNATNDESFLEDEENALVFLSKTNATSNLVRKFGVVRSVVKEDHGGDLAMLEEAKKMSETHKFTMSTPDGLPGAILKEGRHAEGDSWGKARGGGSPKLQQPAANKQEASWIGAGGKKPLWRCDCLEPLWAARWHCMICHQTFMGKAEFHVHKSGCKHTLRQQVVPPFRDRPPPSRPSGALGPPPPHEKPDAKVEVAKTREALWQAVSSISGANTRPLWALQSLQQVQEHTYDTQKSGQSMSKSAEGQTSELLHAAERKHLEQSNWAFHHHITPLAGPPGSLRERVQRITEVSDVKVIRSLQDTPLLDRALWVRESPVFAWNCASLTGPDKARQTFQSKVGKMSRWKLNGTKSSEGWPSEESGGVGEHGGGKDSVENGVRVQDLELKKSLGKESPEDTMFKLGGTETRGKPTMTNCRLHELADTSDDARILEEDVSELEELESLPDQLPEENMAYPNLVSSPELTVEGVALEARNRIHEQVVGGGFETLGATTCVFVRENPPELAVGSSFPVFGDDLVDGSDMLASRTHLVGSPLGLGFEDIDQKNVLDDDDDDAEGTDELRSIQAQRNGSQKSGRFTKRREFLEGRHSGAREVGGEANREDGKVFLRHLKMDLLDMEAALLLVPETTCSARGAPNRRRAWRALVKNATSFVQIAQATVLLEWMVTGEHLSLNWRFWYSSAAAMAATTWAAVALRIHALDDALIYSSVGHKGTREAHGLQKKTLGGSGKSPIIGTSSVASPSGSAKKKKVDGGAIQVTHAGKKNELSS